jgi:hypothetical protein
MPLLFVKIDLEACVPFCSRVMLAFGMTAPLGSDTVPEMIPTAWPSPMSGQTNISTNRTAAVILPGTFIYLWVFMLLRMFMRMPPPKFPRDSLALIKLREEIGTSLKRMLSIEAHSMNSYMAARCAVEHLSRSCDLFDIVETINNSGVPFLGSGERHLGA